ncbi:hypothetical protein BHE74_00012106 [Ensete ventricosum]|nr:hypothetical protein BHE74_00012106 [Ensete ventricosum]
MVQNPPTKSFDTRDSGTTTVDPMNQANSAVDSATKEALAAVEDDPSMAVDPNPRRDPTQPAALNRHRLSDAFELGDATWRYIL